MAIMEIKTLEVQNYEEEATIRYWQQFGWNLKSSQRVYSKDSHLETRSSGIYSVTETVDFVKLVLERDKSSANYDEIVKLEKEYFAIKATLPEKRPPEGYLPKKMSIEQFANEYCPDIRTPKQRFIFSIFLIFGLVVGCSCFFFNSAKIIPILIGIALFITAFIIQSKHKKMMIEIALSGEDKQLSECLAEKHHSWEKFLEESYNSKQKLVCEYDEKINRLDDIMEELQILVK